MRQALHVRIAAIGVVIMALTLAIAALLTHELIRVSARQDLDRVLRQELDEVRLGLPAELGAAAGGDDGASAAEIDLAVQRYLAVHPGSERHLTIIEIGARTLATRDGPPALEQLQLRGGLPGGVPGTLATIPSDVGPLRVLSASLTVGGERPLGTVTIVGELSDGRARANDALVRIGIAGGVGLVVGGVLLWLAVRRALRPVGALAEAARAVDLTDLASRVPDPRRLDEVGRMAHEFNRMLERIAAGEEQRRQLLAAVSHELRTPLAVARGHLELFESLGPTESATAADTAAVLRRELERLGRIVDDLTAVTRGELVGRAAARDPVFVPDVLQALRDRLEGLGVLDVPVGAGPAVVLIGDEDRITQALLNLVVNARTHNPPGTAVEVGARLDGGRVVFDVVDHGHGIDPDVLPRVFEPFVTTRDAGPGRHSGLGLTVVKAVTEAQGGQVAVTSGRDGTTISLVLPVETSDLAPEGAG